MKYCEALNFIKSKQSLGIKPGLSRIKALLERLGNPQNDLKIIHIAGTNGKGTVAATLAKVLYENGFKTGLFTSPWVLDYREQIQLDGEFISETDFAYYVDLIGENECTEFEMLTAIMYRYFADKGADYAVVECGMGGSGDCTNVENENLAVITSISLDHTDFLGTTLDEIAEEKSGILRKNCSCVLYDESLKPHFENKCKRLVTGGISDNLDIVNAVLNELDIPPVSTLVQLPARLERRGEVLLDGGHNVSAAKRLATVLKNEVALIGMMCDKDIDGYLSIVAPKCKRIIVTVPDNPRSMNAKTLYTLAKKYCNDISIIENPVEAVKDKKITLICGSFYLIREIYNLFS